jgi:hypothetical protein
MRAVAALSFLTTCCPDDLLRYAQVWDQLVLASLPYLNRRPQLLWPMVKQRRMPGEYSPITRSCRRWALTTIDRRSPPIAGKQKGHTAGRKQRHTLQSSL